MSRIERRVVRAEARIDLVLEHHREVALDAVDLRARERDRGGVGVRLRDLDVALEPVAKVSAGHAWYLPLRWHPRNEDGIRTPVDRRTLQPGKRVGGAHDRAVAKRHPFARVLARIG